MDRRDELIQRIGESNYEMIAVHAINWCYKTYGSRNDTLPPNMCVLNARSRLKSWYDSEANVVFVDIYNCCEMDNFLKEIISIYQLYLKHTGNVIDVMFVCRSIAEIDYNDLYRFLSGGESLDQILNREY